MLILLLLYLVLHWHTWLLVEVKIARDATLNG